jgi:hypothetical protein
MDSHKQTEAPRELPPREEMPGVAQRGRDQQAAQQQQ